MIVMPASIHARPTRPDGERSTTGANWREAAVPEWDGELLKHNGLRFDAVALLKPDIAHLDGHDSGRAIVLRQDRLEHLRANRVAASSDIEGKLRSQRANALGAGALPLRPHQTQVWASGDRIYLVQASPVAVTNGIVATSPRYWRLSAEA